jgi:hypothetical protein
VGPRAGQDGCGKLRPQLDSISPAFSSGTKRPFRDVTTHPSTEIENEWSYTSTLPYEYKQ